MVTCVTLRCWDLVHVIIVDTHTQESTAAAATVYASDTDLSRRVSEWENKISPILEEEVFVCHVY